MGRKSVDTVNQKPGHTGEDVFSAIHSLMHLIRSQQYRVLRDAPQNLTHMEGKILEYFADHSGATLSQLVAHFGRDKGQVARVIKTLKKEKLLSAEASTKDRRSVQLQLTREGQRIQKSLRERLKRLNKLAVRGLSGKERAQLVRLIAILRKNLEAP